MADWLPGNSLSVHSHEKNRDSSFDSETMDAYNNNGRVTFPPTTDLRDGS